MKLFMIIFCFFVSFSNCFLSQIHSPSQVGEDSDLKIGDASASIVDTVISSMKEPEEESPKTSEKAQQILDELSELRPVNRIDPPREEIKELLEVEHESTIDICQRDYSYPCPLGFTHEKLTDGTHKCTPPKLYSGPCMGQDLTYTEMGKEEKIQWSKNCMANWPCVTCLRNYSNLCPDDWELLGDGLNCTSLNSYSGPCKGEMYSFMDYNIEMQKDWSRLCKAYWPCAHL